MMMTIIWYSVLVVGSVVMGLLAAEFNRWLNRRLEGRFRDAAVGFSISGASVEVDCRKCGQFNRVPADRLRDHPKCGRCKVRLMPGRKVVVCRVNPLEGSLRAELDALWDNEEGLWQSLADHVLLQDKARKEAKDPSLRVVH